MKTAVLAGILATCAVGCTFLISFDDVPDAGQPIQEETADAGKKKNGSSSSSSGESSSSSSSGEVVPPDSGTTETFPPDCDTTVNLGDISCAAYVRPECKTEPNVVADALNDTDLIECDSQSQPKCARRCPHGCVEMPKGFPDQCDDCFGKEDGTYCAKDLRNWASANDVFSIECQGGKTVAKTDCTAGAVPKACATKCTVGGTSPSCCQ